jgi:N-acetylglucosaminyldiphosphoundecaprenol N-acetyl-beta-D-mannosaminyltransferase
MVLQKNNYTAMKTKFFSIFGIPVQNLTLRMTSEKILDLIYKFEKGHSPHYISTLNADFVANVHGWSLEPKHPELLKVIRESTFTTADGFPIVLLSHLLGNPLNGRVTGADLIPDLLELLSVKNKSVYLLGGEETVTKLAAEKLQNKYKGLQIKGIDCSMIYTEGLNLINSQERDQLILEQIHQAQPDVLLLCLGNPKQEIWFKRVRHLLSVPVVIGIGGTLNFISGKILRAPPQVQSMGLEWLWRLVQEPGRLFKRYLNDFVKLIWLGVPLIFYHNLNQLLTSHFRKNPEQQINQQALLFISAHRTISILTSPKTLNGNAVNVLEQEIIDSYNREAIVINMQHTLHIDLEGIAFLIKTRIRAEKDNKKIFLLGIRSNVKLLLIFHKAWDLLRKESFSEPAKILELMNTNELYEAIDQTANTVTVAFLGSLGPETDYGHSFQKLVPMLQQKNCTIDLTYCTDIHNIAFEFLLRIRQMMKTQKTHLTLTGVNPTVKRELKAAKLLKYFRV